MDYQGIIFPDRAEALKDAQFRHYKVFLNHWSPIARTLRLRFEDLAIRGASHCVMVHGDQGSGKTLFAQKLVEDQKQCAKVIQEGRSAQGRFGSEINDDNNLWSLMTGSSRLDQDLIIKATLNAEILHFEDDDSWLSKAVEWRKANQQRYCILVADNAERSYFRQALSGLSASDYVAHANQPELINRVAQRFVALMRGQLRGVLIIALTNDATFAQAFRDAVERQHQGLVNLETLGLPDGESKETVVRVNTNRLNPVSYWYCLDRAGPAEKLTVFQTLRSAETYPAAFKAVDAALKGADSRGGRPARKNQLTFAVISDSADCGAFQPATFGLAPQEITVERKWCKMLRYVNWAALPFPTLKDRERSLISSEWDLRVLYLAEPFVAALLDVAASAKVKVFLELAFTYHGPGTLPTTKAAHRSDVEMAIDAFDSYQTSTAPDFWAKGASRNGDYERALSRIYPGRYDRGSAYMMNFRPDLVVSPFSPCGVLKAIDDSREELNYAIRRDANLVEFTAIKEYRHEKLISYMGQKLLNYLQITQEQ